MKCNFDHVYVARRDIYSCRRGATLHSLYARHDARAAQVFVFSLIDRLHELLEEPSFRLDSINRPEHREIEEDLVLKKRSIGAESM